MSRRQVVRVGVAAATTVTVSRHGHTGNRPQGLVIESESPLRVGSVSAHRLVLWSSTAPETVDVEVDEAGELLLWHVWRDGDLVQAWEANAGIEVDDDGDDLGLKCHDGHGGGPDLDVRLRFDRAWTQPDAGEDHRE